MTQLTAMNKYLTYDDYILFGGMMSEYDFNSVVLDAQFKLDFYTFNRLKCDTAFTDSVKFAMFKIVELISKFEAFKAKASDTDNPVIVKQSNDDVSESYGGYIADMSPQTVTEMQKQLEKDISNTINVYLAGEFNQKGESLLKRGVY